MKLKGSRATTQQTKADHHGLVIFLLYLQHMQSQSLSGPRDKPQDPPHQWEGV